MSDRATELERLYLERLQRAQKERQHDFLAGIINDAFNDAFKGTGVLGMTGAVSNIEVKALEWRANSRNSVWTGELLFGVYYVIDQDGRLWRATRGQLLSEATAVEIAVHADLDTVKAAVQSDWSKAIRSALIPAPVGEVREALSEAIAAYDRSDIPTHYHSHASFCDAMRRLKSAVGSLAPIDQNPVKPL